MTLGHRPIVTTTTTGPGRVKLTGTLPLPVAHRRNGYTSGLTP